jgi:hypothetical protein
MEREMRIRNYSEKSITSYLYSVQMVSGYFNLPPDRITIDQVKAYLYLSTKNIVQQAKSTRLSVRGRFYNRTS